MAEKQKVICLINGPWQAVSCLATIESTGFLKPGYLLLPIIVEMYDNTFFYTLTKDVLGFAGFKETGFIPKDMPLKQMADKVCQLESFFGTTLYDADHLIIFGDHRPVARYFCNFCKKAEITVYEDGMRTYIAGYLKRNSIFQNLFDKLASVVYKPYSLITSRCYEQRIKTVSLLLGSEMELPFYEQNVINHVASGIVKNILSKVDSLHIKNGFESSFILIVGQYYYKLNQLSFEEELNIYIDAAEKISECGYVPVWRGHIREEDLMFSAIQQRCDKVVNFSEIVNYSHYPIEFYADCCMEHCYGVVSIASSSLFYFKHFFGIESFTLCTEDLVKKMDMNHKHGLILAMKYIRPFDEFFGEKNEK